MFEVPITATSMYTLLPIILPIFILIFMGVLLKTFLKIFISFFKGDISSLPAPFNNILQDKNKDGISDIINNLDQVPESQRNVMQMNNPMPTQNTGIPQTSGDNIRKFMLIMAFVILIGWLASYVVGK